MLRRAALMAPLRRAAVRTMCQKATTTAQASQIVRFLDENGVVRYGQPVGEPDQDRTFAYAPEGSQRRRIEEALLLEDMDDGYGRRQRSPPGTDTSPLDPASAILTRHGLPLFTKPLRAWGTKDTPIPVKISKLLSPIPTPPAVWACGVNFTEAYAELGLEVGVYKYPVVFLQNPAAVNNPFDPIVIPKVARGECDYEVELATVIGVDPEGRLCKNVSVEEAKNYILGYTVANDVGARKWQGRKGGGQWARAKSFDTFLPLGPCLVSPSAIGDPQNLRMTTRLNDEVMQDGNTSDMVWSVYNIISFLSQETTLLPGTVVLSGTPRGIGFVRNPPRYLKNNDRIAVEIQNIGTVYNHVLES
uniref:Fumarylacetoacetase-like C-terminal domain-containing protein n=1 Tax=Hemiselmis tepida TaxID=464990 RepID=A0A7S0YGZ8_9CRYP